MFDAIKQGAPSERYIDYDGLVRKTYRFDGREEIIELGSPVTEVRMVLER